ncbi:cystatin-B-like isoform X1 [Elephas maximus indicus]|uniref:cystatin-B-like isoform X1 n=1 Tax=Elephas maximus indicus TaxID=99487 RepID=UPI00211657AA|nr:cystatin-B-like isoform X1 [Elephas maximus indicus]
MVKHLAANQKVGDWNPPATRREKDVSICCCKDYSPAYLGPDSGTAVAFRSAPLCPPALSALLLVPTHAVKVPAMQPATTEAQETLEIANQVKPQLEEKENKMFPMFKAVESKRQVVTGTKDFIRIHVGDKNFVHLQVFQSLPHKTSPTLSSY